MKHRTFLGFRFRRAPSRALQPDRTKRAGWDVSDPPFSPPGAARKGLPCAGPSHGRREGRSRPEVIPAGRLGADQ
ncbi:MAG: hypothetical protein OXG81_02695 [Acidobacteria bacterium]|nr:hypothetical protein [Acidobacteriota bacterium]